MFVPWIIKSGHTFGVGHNILILASDIGKCWLSVFFFCFFVKSDIYFIRYVSCVGKCSHYVVYEIAY